MFGREWGAVTADVRRDDHGWKRGEKRSRWVVSHARTVNRRTTSLGHTA